MSDIPAEYAPLDQVNFRPEEKKTFDADVTKSFNLKERLRSSDYVVIDFVRDSYDILQLRNGSRITRGVEIEKYDLLGKFDVDDLLALGTLTHFETWHEAAVRFAALVHEHAHTVVIVNARWMPLYIHDWQISLVDDFDQYGIARRNYLISHYQTIFAALCPEAHVVEVPPWVNYADPKHPWGPNPSHYHEKTQSRMAEEGRASLERSAWGPRAPSAEELELKAAAAEASRQRLRAVLNDEGIFAAPEY